MATATARTVIEGTLALDYFTGTNPAVDVCWAKGPKGSKLVLAVGENASGKSFYRRVIQSWCQHRSKEGIECIDLSMERRSVSSVTRAFIYGGDEGRDSTGRLTVSSILGAIHTSQGREKPHILIWDEPDLGLSEAGSLGAAQEINEFMQDPPKRLVMAVVVSHSRTMLRGLREIPHHFLHFGKESHTLDSWLQRPVQPRRLDEIREANLARYKAIQVILNAQKARS
jgi:hypothetical protein